MNEKAVLTQPYTQVLTLPNLKDDKTTFVFDGPSGPSSLSGSVLDQSIFPNEFRIQIRVRPLNCISS